VQDRKSRELAALVGILSAVNAARSVGAICKVACEWTSELFDLAGTAILLAEPGSRGLRVAAAAGPAPVAPGPRGVVARTPLYERMLETCGPAIGRGRAEPAGRRGAKKAPRALALVPIGTSRRIRGALALALPRAEDFGDDALGILVDIARSVDIAIEKAELVESLRRQIQDTAVVRDASAELTGTLSLGPLLQRVAASLVRVVNVTQAFILLYDPTQDALVGVASTEPLESVRALVRIPASGRERSLALEAWRTRASIAVEDASRDRRVSRRLVRFYGEKSLLAIPLVSGEEAIGAVMLADQRQMRRFLPEEIARAQTLANQAALAIENARRHEQALRERDRAEVLLDVARTTSGTLNLRECLKRVVERLYALSNVSWCAIATPDASGQELADMVHHGSPPELERALARLLGRRLDSFAEGRHLLEAERPFIVEDVVRARLVPRRVAREFNLRSLLLVPVRSHGALVAVMALGYLGVRADEPRIDRDEIALAEGVARTVALAVANARAFGEIARQERTLDMLTSRIITAQEEERRRLARELHDGVNQSLTAVTLFLERLVRRAAKAGGPSAAVEKDLVEVSGAIGDAIREIRRLCGGLRPLELEHLGFSAALRAFARTFVERSGIDLEIEIPERLPALAPAAEINLYRIVQEALSNVAQHARARRAAVRVAASDGRVRVVVQDDGCGFDQRHVARRGDEERGLGLLAMSERAHLLGGELEVRSSPGRGTRIEVSVPASGAAPATPPAGGDRAAPREGGAVAT
jgi:signal transduction histidine kinase